MALELSSLKEVLNKQNSLIEELRALTSEQLQALKQDDLNKITYITSHQEYIGRQLAVSELQRRMILEEYSQEHGIEIKHFSELQLHIDSDNFAQIQKSRDDIINNCQNLKEEQGVNALLLNQGMRFTERVMGVINSKKTFVYGKTGDIKRSGNKGIIDANV
jgi:flagellar biosynthesis/type III secretory pathway chaperone